MQHINTALKALPTPQDETELSVLQRVLKMDDDAKIATNLALDMFLVGIDTVSLLKNEVFFFNG